jgi:hypothetical protein
MDSKHDDDNDGDVDADAEDEDVPLNEEKNAGIGGAQKPVKDCQKLSNENNLVILLFRLFLKKNAFCKYQIMRQSRSYLPMSDCTLPDMG